MEAARDWVRVMGKPSSPTVRAEARAWYLALYMAMRRRIPNLMRSRGKNQICGHDQVSGGT